jgi:microcystin-dependent protein
MIKCPYPIHGVMFSMDDPSTMWPDTTWSECAAGRVLYGGTPGITGGAKTVTLTVNEIPSHRHNYEGAQFKYKASGMHNVFRVGGGESPTSTGATGGTTGHNNLMPYIVCGIWKRIS